MNRMAGTNPYSRPQNRDDGSAPDPSGRYRYGGPGAYSVPDIPETTDPDWTTGYSPEIAAGGSPDGTAVPSDIRIGTREDPPMGHNDPGYWDRRVSNQNTRYARDEYTVGWDVQQQKVPAGQNPMWAQERLPTRPTADDAPAGYMMQRYWHIPRNVKDALDDDAVAHFSMADHRRVYEIMGQAPRGKLGVNTYRAQPQPWDDQLFVPPGDRNVTGDIFGNQQFRL